jgi:hypothetical protein
VAEYGHGTNFLSAITGGFVYRGAAFPRMYGFYIMGDSFSSQIRGLKRDGTNWVIEPLLYTNVNLASFGEDENGELYAADIFKGKIYQVGDGGAANPPTFDPPAGVSPTDQITVNCLSTGVDIHYTTNGIDPVQTDPTVGAGSNVTITAGTTLKARAYRNDLLPSAVASATYPYFRAGIPTFNPAQGPLTNGQLIAMSTITPGATIRYTLDGTAPGPSSTIYTNPVDINVIGVLTAQASRNGFSNSPIQTASFSFPIQSVSMTANGGLIFNWPSVLGKTYQVQSAPGFSQWSNVGNSLPGTGFPLSFTNAPGAFTNGTLFFRVQGH